MTDPLIVARGLKKAFGATRAVDGLDLDVAPGEIFGLVGPDGAGKTTAIRMLCGILDADAGAAAVGGFDVRREPEAVKRRIGYMSQRFSLYGDLSVAENLRFFAELHRVPRETRRTREAELLAFSRLAPYRARLAQHLSGGMKQKLALACTLIHTPAVLFLDEPTTGVDPVSRRDFWTLLHELLRGGVTIFVSTPYMDEAERCGRVALLQRGRVRVCDTPAALRGRMQGRLLEVVATPQRRAREVLALLPRAAGVQVFGDRLHLWQRDGGADEAAVCAHLESHGLEACRVRSIAPGLEDVFVSLLSEDGSADGTVNGTVSGTANRAKGWRSARDGGPHAPVSPGRFHGGSAPSGAADAAVTPAGDRRERPGEPAVAVEGLVKRFGAFTAVDGISFAVPYGQIFGFLGPNGAGKSTTIRMLCGILAPTSGRGSVAGFDIASESRRIKTGIGYMSQRFSLYEDLTVDENIAFYGGVYGVEGARLAARRRWILAMADLEARAGSLARELSAGWKQRLALGCAVVHEPRILFLDEPTSGVDPLSRRAFWELIAAVADEGVTVFVTTHIMDDAEHCDRLGMIYGGRLIALGSPRELKEQQAATARAGAAAPPGPPLPPTLEDVFVSLVERADRADRAGSAGAGG